MVEPAVFLDRNHPLNASFSEGSRRSMVSKCYTENEEGGERDRERETIKFIDLSFERGPVVRFRKGRGQDIP